MPVTDKLLHLHKVDTQLRGLRKRIDSAQRYLDHQEGLAGELRAQQVSLSSQIRQLEAHNHNQENEIASVDQRMDELRTRLAEAQTNKEYTALLTQLNTIKADKGGLEESTLESMSRLEELRSTLTEVEASLVEREKIRDVALAERDRRAKEIKDRLGELEAQREEAAKDIPQSVLEVFEEAVLRHGEDAMAAIEEHSRRHIEYACGACQVLLPMEFVSRVLKRGDLTQCPSCTAILYATAELRDSMVPAGKR